MLIQSLIGAALIATTVVIHAVGTTYWVKFLSEHFTGKDGRVDTRRSFRILISTGLVLAALHAIQISLWAIVYRNISYAGEIDTFETAVYFSFVTFTTLGYGDITLSESGRVLSGIQALNGILLVGWSTAILFAVVQKLWQSDRSFNVPDERR
jgi:hypothetical protein